MQIRPYLTFGGNCQEAIELYTKAFNTKVTDIVRASDMPQNPDNSMSMFETQKDLIVQATLQLGDNFIRLSDCFGELNDPPSERVSIIVECSMDEVKQGFSILSEEGSVGSPLQAAFYSPCTGVVYDKFGVMWIFMSVAEN